MIALDARPPASARASSSPAPERVVPEPLLGWVMAIGMLPAGLYNPRWWVPAAIAFVAFAAWRIATVGYVQLTSTARVVVAALAGLAILSSMSTAWAAYSRQMAWEESARSATYALVAWLGAAMLCRADARRAFVEAYVATVAIVFATAFAWMLLPFSEPASAFALGLLNWPVGYADGFAAIESIALWLAAGLSFRAARRGETAGASLWASAASVVCSALLITGSQASITANVTGVVVAALVLPDRLRAALLLACVAAPAALARLVVGSPQAALVDLVDLYGKSPSVVAGAVGRAEHDIRAYALVALLVAIVSALVTGLIAGRSWFSSPPPATARNMPTRRTVRRLSAATVAIGLVLVASIAVPPTRSLLASATGNCLQYATVAAADREASDPSIRGDNNRCDYWSVAATAMLERPLTGWGSGGFEGRYALLRHSDEAPRQAHSLPFEKAAELGVAGGLLVLLLFGGCVATTIRVSRMDADARIVGGAACAAIACWSIHAIFDFMWNIPAVTLPVIVLLAGLANSGATSSAGRRPRPVVVVLVATVVALAVLPLALADMYGWRALGPSHGAKQLAAASRDASRAAVLAPFWAEPLKAKMILEVRRGNDAAARRALRDAIAREPDDWSVRVVAARTCAAIGDVACANRHRAAAERLNRRLAHTPPAALP